MRDRCCAPSGRSVTLGGYPPVDGGVGARRRAAFLDRDGVLNELIPDPVSGVPESPLRLEDVRLVANAAAAASRLAQAGFVLVCVSNQPAAAKGKLSVAQVYAIHERVSELLARAGVQLCASRLCLHHPEGVAPALTRRCDCRKPAPGMLIDIAHVLHLDLSGSWMFGDTDADVLAGRAAGCATMLIQHPGSSQKRFNESKPNVIANDLADGVARLLSRCSLQP